MFIFYIIQIHACDMLSVLGVGDSVFRGDIPQELRLSWYD